MIKATNVNAIRIVKWYLDFVVFAGGIFTGIIMILTIGARFMGSEFGSMSAWPVKILFGGSNSLALTVIDITKAASNQILVEAIPSRTILRFVGIKSIALIGFDVAWILLSYGTILMIAYIMRKIFLHMESNDFFDQKTPARLRIIGWTIIGASLLKSVIIYVFGLYTSSLINGIPTTVKTAVLNPLGKPVAILTEPLILISYEQLLFGTFILALAIAFQKGLILKQEQSLTI